MEHIRVITDKDFNIEPIEFQPPTRTRVGARGIVLDSDGKIAIFNKTLKNEFKLPGGGVEDNEDLEIAFKREVMEETGCEVEIIQKLGTIVEEKSQDNFIQTSHVFVSKVINNTQNLNLTQKEIDEGAKLIWVTPSDGLKLVSNSINNLVGSKYENVYHSKFIVTRDATILEYYINNFLNN